jgi:hypothetical protein
VISTRRRRRSRSTPAAKRLGSLRARSPFERYWDEFEARRRGETVADNYSPYEIRTAAAFVMLGQKRRALELLEWLMADQPVAPWCAWPEIAWRDRRAPRFLGDLPHGWIASSFARAVRRMIAYERRDDGALVLAAGVPAAWVREAPGVRVRALPTHFGRLDCTLCADDDEQVRVTLGGDVRPPGGFVIVSPLDRPLRTAFVDGRRVATAPDRITLQESARHIVLVY